ncbi:MAG: hypothetical protein ACP5KX_07395 [Caldisericia bacterium]
MAIKRCGECPCISKKTTGGPIIFSEEYWCLKYDVKKNPNQEACAYAKEQSSKGYKVNCK